MFLISAHLELWALNGPEDVARALGISTTNLRCNYSCCTEAIVDEETDEAIKITIDTALAESEELRQYAKQYPKLFSVARKLEGIVARAYF